MAISLKCPVCEGELVQDPTALTKNSGRFRLVCKGDCPNNIEYLHRPGSGIIEKSGKLGSPEPVGKAEPYIEKKSTKEESKDEESENDKEN